MYHTPTTKYTMVKLAPLTKRDQVIEDTIKWLSTIENEERRKLVNALKRTKEVLNNPNNPKLLMSKREFGERTLHPVILKGERHGKPRFSLEFLPEEDIKNKGDYLFPEEASQVAEKTIVERSSYAHRLKLAFIFLTNKFGTKNNKDFVYSTDGDHFTKAYRSVNEAPKEEKVISHFEAVKVIEADKKINPKAYESPAYGVAQTKVFRVSVNSVPSTGASGNIKTSWITISKALEDVNNNDKRAYYQCRQVYDTEEKVRSNKEYKLVWPTNQVKSLIYLLELSKDLILQQNSKTLGDGDQHYAVLFEKKSSSGPAGILYKALICPGTEKTSASKNACTVVTQVWTIDENDPKTNNLPKAITCLSPQDCSLLKHLIEVDTKQR